MFFAPTAVLIKKEKIFDVLKWLAAMTSRIPDHGEQMVCYYGYYSNLFRGFRQKEYQDALIPSTSLESPFEPSHLTLGRLDQAPQYSSLFIKANC